MKRLFAVMVIASFLFPLSGCSNKGIDLNKDTTITYDSKIHGVPTAAGGPKGKGVGANMNRDAGVDTPPPKKR